MYLKVSGRHTIFYTTLGMPSGIPVCCLHGGPGGGISPEISRIFDLNTYYVILFDQRGCGQSQPTLELHENTTSHLIEDIEKLRLHLKIEQWILVGESWGTTLALLYGQKYSSRVKAFLLRGIWLARQSDIDWLYQDGASHILPEYWERFISPVPEDQRNNILQAYILGLRRKEGRDVFVREYARWEIATSQLSLSSEEIEKAVEEEVSSGIALNYATLETYYYKHNSWLTKDNQIIEDLHRIKHIPCTIVHGRYDVQCRVSGAYELHKAWPGSKLIIVPDGHMGPLIDEAMLQAVQTFKCNHSIKRKRNEK